MSKLEFTKGTRLKPEEIEYYDKMWQRENVPDEQRVNLVQALTERFGPDAKGTIAFQPYETPVTFRTPNPDNDAIRATNAQYQAANERYMNEQDKQLDYYRGQNDFAEQRQREWSGQAPTSLTLLGGNNYMTDGGAWTHRGYRSYVGQNPLPAVDTSGLKPMLPLKPDKVDEERFGWKVKEPPKPRPRADKRNPMLIEPEITPETLKNDNTDTSYDALQGGSSKFSNNLNGLFNPNLPWKTASGDEYVGLNQKREVFANRVDRSLEKIFGPEGATEAQLNTNKLFNYTGLKAGLTQALKDWGYAKPNQNGTGYYIDSNAARSGIDKSILNWIPQQITSPNPWFRNELRKALKAANNTYANAKETSKEFQTAASSLARTLVQAMIANTGMSEYPPKEK